MAVIIEDTKGKIRDRPIAPELREVLLPAAEAAGIDTVLVDQPERRGITRAGQPTSSFKKAGAASISRIPTTGESSRNSWQRPQPTGPTALAPVSSTWVPKPSMSVSGQRLKITARLFGVRKEEARMRPLGCERQPIGAGTGRKI
jgi:hypothetical protein